MGGRLVRAFAWLAGGALALLAAPGWASSLEGTWHVLVHYRDADVPHPERERWEDRVWVFEREGERLTWTDYPIVVFEDDDGRFEAFGSNRQVRTLHFWEPNEAQLAQIRSGLEVNPRGSKRKSLRGSDASGWRSAGGPRAGSASVITYSETWAVETPADLPVFVREDELGSGRAMGVEGRTEYRTETVDGSGSVLRGRYERDGTRHGTFVLRSAGAVSPVRGSGLTPNERVRAMLLGQAGWRMVDRDRLRELLDEPREDPLPETKRAAIRSEVAAALEEHVRRQDEDPARLRPEIERLSREIERLLVEERRSLDEVRRLLEQGRLAP